MPSFCSLGFDKDNAFGEKCKQMHDKCKVNGFDHDWAKVCSVCRGVL